MPKKERKSQKGKKLFLKILGIVYLVFALGGILLLSFSAVSPCNGTELCSLANFLVFALVILSIIFSIIAFGLIKQKRWAPILAIIFHSIILTFFVAIFPFQKYILLIVVLPNLIPIVLLLLTQFWRK